MEYVFALLALLAYVGVNADRKIGCLFDTDLCEDYEICINDALFGRCQSPPATEVYTYDITAAEVDHLRTLLQKLSYRGLTWEDETTQQILSKELAKLDRIPLYLSEAANTRPVIQTVATGDQSVKPSEAELARSVQKYLKHLGYLPKTKTDGFHGVAPPEFAPSWKTSSLPAVEPDGTILLLAALQQYLSRTQPPQADRGEPLPYAAASRPRLFLSHGEEAPPLDRLLPKSGDPVSAVEEALLQKVLRSVDRPPVAVGSLSGREMEQLAALVEDALPEGGAALEELQAPEAEQGEPATELPSREEGEAGTAATAAPYTTQQPSAPERKKERRSSSDDKGLLGKLLEYLDHSDSASLPRLRGARGRGVSVETVRSRVHQRELQKKSSSVAEVTQVSGWISEQKLAPSSGLEAKLQRPLAPSSGLEAKLQRPLAPSSGLEAKLQRPLAPSSGLEAKLQRPLAPSSGLEAKLQRPLARPAPAAELQLDVQSQDDAYGYVITDEELLPTDKGLQLMEILAHKANIQMTDFLELSVIGSAVIFRVRSNAQNVSTAAVASIAEHQREALEREAKVKILEAGVTDKSMLKQIPTKYSRSESTKYLVLTAVSLVCIVGVLMASVVVYCLRHRSHHKLKEKLTSLGTDTGSDATATYQELCRQRMAVKPPVGGAEPRINSVSSQLSDGPMPSPSRASPASWSEEPAHSNMDISTGHMILSYMEDHLKNKDRLEQEWAGLCAYEAEPNATSVGLRDGNAKRNRCSSVVAYDHSRIPLRLENSQGTSDYINASPIMDHDPRYPAYIATQGPLPSTVADFWQMVWESGAVVIVMLTPLTEGGVKQCYHYWPDEGSNLYHIYEVNLVSEHVWCEDFLVRSFYLKNMQSNESRTVSQFHYHTWSPSNAPDTHSLLDFRRKVNKCYRGRSCPIIVHCSDGAGRTGTYILIDMVLNKMAKGAKEIDIAATLEHLRDQRACMVQTKEQFEFALTTVAEEVNAILQALPQ
ncbi:receptor-type tyrosine-protein phosphatase N2-like isoform X2 [Sardina pilchardus]|uniref:receptor-type tyrosine-protein phosphatase N2-like isoform X2 n=1 Tax=Sardina pilchardus TaxID=27697 RepID=UPI002E0EE13B